MGKERSGGGAASLSMEKQIWEETDAEEKEQSRAGKHGKLWCWTEERAEERKGEERGREPYLAVVLILWKRFHWRRMGRSCSWRGVGSCSQGGGSWRRFEEEAVARGETLSLESWRFARSGWMAFFTAFFPVRFLMNGKNRLKSKIEGFSPYKQSSYIVCCTRKLVEMMCSVFVASWTGVIKYHGPRPSSRPYQVFVANHTSMIDFIILEQMTAFAVIMQKHPGWVGFIQKTILESVGCIWFNRNDLKDREVVGRKLRDHVQHPDNNPLLIFPEGTCVNNQYTVMFKKGAFELGCAVCPIAIKYNKIFVDAFWNSKKQSFTMHLVRLMTSWAVVCDVWFLEPQYLREGETAIEFTERVRDMIAARAGLKKVPWDGYLKHNRPSPKHTEEKQRMFAESVLRRLEEN
ncbi:Glycerol-3-phosphate acyltransferase 3 [Triticum urartu]|uniref:Glycerol-3-phosphate acyltransferase 3 n=1 Tax=Triticum urartu TaxID=4572 RepID=M8A3J6_TRIUA|nr:Glycerol-3-phosphate acyltransferase 3 [Triticum urartu]